MNTCFGLGLGVSCSELRGLPGVLRLLDLGFRLLWVQSLGALGFQVEGIGCDASTGFFLELLETGAQGSGNQTYTFGGISLLHWHTKGGDCGYG